MSSEIPRHNPVDDEDIEMTSVFRSDFLDTLRVQDEESRGTIEVRDFDVVWDDEAADIAEVDEVISDSSTAPTIVRPDDFMVAKDGSMKFVDEKRTTGGYL